MATGPCGYEFRSAFSCFHYSQADPKGSDCYDDFKKMQDCMSKFPVLYDMDKDDIDPLMENGTEDVESSGRIGSDTTTLDAAITSTASEIS